MVRLAPVLAGAQMAIAAGAAGARAQEPKRAIGAELALVASSVRDDLLVPHAQSGGGLSLGGGLMSRLGPGLLDFGARLGLAVGADRLGARGLALEHGLGLRYCLLLRSTETWRVAAGPGAGIDADVFFFGDWDDAHAYWMGVSWLGAAGRAWRPLGRTWRLDLTGELGLLGRASRPPTYRLNKQDPLASPGFYFRDVYRDADAVWIGNWQLLRARIELSPTQGRSWITRAWRFGVELRMARAADPEAAFALALKLVAAKSWGL
jgi:hypothetical protein